MKIKGLYVNKWLMVIMLMVLFRPEIINKDATLDLIFNILRVIVSFIVIIDYLTGQKFSKLVLLEFLAWGLYNVYSVYNGTWTYNLLINMIICITIVCFTESSFRKNCCYLFEALNVVLIVYLIANTITILMGNDVQNLFLGFDNDIIMILLPLVGIKIYGSYYLYNKLTKCDYIIMALSLLDFLLTWSASAILTLFVFYMIIIFNKTKIRSKAILKLINSKVIIVVTMLLWFFLYDLKAQKIFNFLIVGILHKDITLTYRTKIWANVIDAIRDNWLLGYGNYLQNNEYTSRFIYMYPAPHNIYLNFLLMGGVVGLIFIICIINYSFRYINKNLDEKNIILLIAFFCFMLCGTVASLYPLENLAFLLAVADRVKYVVNAKRQNNLSELN